ncbi:MAG TPA: sigma-70 family RNA polymerase sigma factor [Ktedonobacteraceae bacterium]|jgi:RNA polymerase sigma-70 factor (ECF subfamily)|nr:sigma-70 family RNA polymerase sigma factor [Ktedonobacteraceae bacterium]
MQPDDAELAALLASDLDRHFGQMVLVYEARLRAFMTRQIDNVHETEDIVQEAFMQAYFALARYTPQQIAGLVLRPWLYKIALNVFYSRLRKARLPAIALDFSEESPHLTIEEKREQQPDMLLEQHEMRQELEELLKQLPATYRTVINLYYFADLSYQEIADLLHMPMGSVKSYLYRGIRRLRKVLELSQARGQGTHVTRE